MHEHILDKLGIWPNMFFFARLYICTKCDDITGYDLDKRQKRGATVIGKPKIF